MTELNAFSQLKDVRRTLKEEAVKRTREAAEAARAKSRKHAFEHMMLEMGVTPLKTDRRVEHAPPPAAAVVRRPEPEQGHSRQYSDVADPVHFVETIDGKGFYRRGLPPDLARKLRRGNMRVQASVDLHELGVDEARETVTAFLQEAARRGQRVLRIIHGVGYGRADGQGVLKNLVPRWLKQHRETMCYVEAPFAQGGNGALLVLLEKTGL